MITQAKDELKNNVHLVSRIWPQIKPYSKKLFLIFCTLIPSALLIASQPFFLQSTIDSYLGSKGAGSIKYLNLPVTWAPALLGASVLLVFALKSWQSFNMQATGQDFVASLRAHLFGHIQGMSIDFFERNQVGKLLNRLTNDLEALSEMITSGLLGGLADLFTLFGITVFMFLLNSSVATALLCLLPLVIIATAWFQRIYREGNGLARTELARLNSLFQESLNGLEVIKVHGQQKNFVKEFDLYAKGYENANNTFIAADASYSAFVESVGIFGTISTIIVLLLGWAKGLSAGELVAFVSYSQMFFFPIRSLSDKFGVFQSGFTSLEKVSELLDEAPALEERGGVAALTSFKLLEIKDLSFSYPSRPARVLSQINLKLYAGQSLGLVGRTGSGKSTIAKLLCRFYEPSEGTISIDSRPLSYFDRSELRRKVLWIPQRSFLFTGTILQNLLLELVLNVDIYEAQLQRQLEISGLAELVSKLPAGWNTQIGHGGIELSAGQKQLINLTRALVQDPLVLILDEATSSLDAESEELVTAATTSILHSGKTIVFVAHRLHLVRECNEIMVLKEGRVLERGSHLELMEQEGYYAGLAELSS